MTTNQNISLELNKIIHLEKSEAKCVWSSPELIAAPLDSQAAAKFFY